MEITERFMAKHSQSLTSHQASRLKRVLHYCPDWTVQYKLAGRLGFSDLQGELINSQATPIIKDLIASNKLPPPITAKIS